MTRESLLERMLVRILNLTQSPEEQYAEALQALEGTKTGWQDAARAFRFFKYAANRGHLKAIVKLGMCYEHGIGVREDPIEALLFYLKAAEGGSAEGIGCVANCQIRGVGTESNIQSAIRLYRTAAEKNDPESQSGLGLCYEEGTGVDPNSDEAFRWYQRSADNGSAEGQFNLGRCYFFGIGVAVDYDQAAHWFSVSAGQGKDAIDHFLRKQPYPAISSAMCFLGLCHEMGFGVEKDAAQAERWYCEAAHRQHPDACRKYAEFLKADSQEAENRESAEIWLKRAQSLA